jgi:rhamnose utilization protein RhaD (predicted bifunctional aldolase and dehydrogenase)
MAMRNQTSQPVDVPDVLSTLVELSRAYGSDPEMVLGGGGNTSVKLDGHLLVKASGASLSQIGPENFVDLDRAALQKLLEAELPTSRAEREAAFKEALLAARRSPATAQRPSVESVLHHLMPGRFVVHLHATEVNQFACSQDGPALVAGHLGDDVAWVDLVDPGFILAKALDQQLQAFTTKTGKPRPRAVIMQNHGVVVSGETPGEARAQLDWLLARLRTIKDGVRPAGLAAPATSAGRRTDQAVRSEEASEATGRLSAALVGLLTDAGERAPEVLFDQSDVVAGFVGRSGGRELALGGPLTPDQIVYCLSFPLWVEHSDSGTGGAVEGRLEAGVRAYSKRYGTLPKVVLIERVGMLTWGATRPEADTARLVYRDAIKVMTGASNLGGVRYLDEEFRTFIENWELESYRRKRLFEAR